MLEGKKVREPRAQGSAGAEKSPKTKNARNSDVVTIEKSAKRIETIKPSRRIASLSEHCAPCPPPGPSPGPLLGGLPGNSLLLGQQAAALRLAQLKTQIALTQISNTLSFGGRGGRFSPSSNKSVPYISSTPPSPTAAAINLLNQLKIANTMSRQLYNPYASGNQGSSQGQYGLSSSQSETESQRSFHGTSSFSSCGTSSVTPNSSERMIPPLMSQLRNYRPVQSRATSDEDIASSVDIHISRAREEVRLLGGPTHRPVEQDTRFSSSQRDEFRSSDTRMASYSMSSAHQGQRHNLDAQDSSSSLDWISSYKRPTSDNSKYYPPPASSCSAGGGDSRFDTHMERRHDMQEIPGLGDYVKPAPSVPPAPPAPSRPKYTSEIAANILLHFGLEKEDLELLISYPEDQITPANLPFIMREIRLQKDKRTTAAAQSNPFPEPHSSRTVSDSYSLSRLGGEVMQKEKTSAPILQPSKVIDYGHTGKYTAESGDVMGRKSDRDIDRTGSMFSMDNTSSRHSLEPLQRSEWKSSATGSSRELPSSYSSLSSSSSSALSSAPPASSNQTKQSLPQPNQSLQSIFSLISQPKTDPREHKTEAPRLFPLKELEPDHQSTSVTRPPSALFHGINPTHPGLALSGRNEASGLQDPSKTTGKGLVVEHIVRQQTKPKEQIKQTQTLQTTTTQQLQPAPREQIQKTQQMQILQILKEKVQQTEQQHLQHMQSRQLEQTKLLQTQKQQQPVPIHQTQKEQETQKQEVQQIKQTQTPKQKIQINLQHKQQVKPTQKPQTQTTQPTPQAAQATWPSAFTPGKPFVLPTVLLPQNRGSPQSNVTPPVQLQTVRGQPSYSPLMVAPPGVQPPSKLTKAPPEAMVNDYAATPPKVFPHACSLCNQTCTGMQGWILHQNTSIHLENCKRLCNKYPEWAEEIDGKSRQKRRSRSKSSSPRRHRGTEGRRRSKRRSRSRSRSPQRSRRRHRSPSWSSSSSSSPRYDNRGSRRYRSRSRSHERRSPARRNRREPTPKRSDRRGSTPRRSDRRGSTPRRSDRRGSTPRRRDRRGSSPRRKHERQSSSEDSSPEREKQARGSSAERLAKKLLETPGLQSLSGQSDLEAVVKTLAPALVAELAKIKSSDKGRKRSLSPSAEGKRSSSSTSSSSTAKKESTTKFSKRQFVPQTESGKASPSTMVKLHGIHHSQSHAEVLEAVEHFGKTKSVVLFRAKLEAIVIFEKEEDAKKLKSIKKLDVNGVVLTVLYEKEDVPKESETSQKKKSDTPSASTSESNKGKVAASSTTTYKGATSVTKEKVTPLESKTATAPKSGSKTEESTEEKSEAAAQESVVSEKEPAGGTVVKENGKGTGAKDKAGTKAVEVDVKTPTPPKSGSNTEESKQQPKTEKSKAADPESAVVLDKKPDGATATKENVKATVLDEKVKETGLNGKEGAKAVEVEVITAEAPKSGLNTEVSKQQPQTKRSEAAAQESAAALDKKPDGASVPKENVKGMDSKESVKATVPKENVKGTDVKDKEGAKAVEVEVKSVTPPQSGPYTEESKQQSKTERSEAAAQESAVVLDKKPEGTTVPKENVKGMDPKDGSEPSIAGTSSNEENLKAKAQESSVVEKTKETITENQSEGQAERAVDANEPGESGVTVEKPVKVKICTAEAVPEISAVKPGKSEPQASSVRPPLVKISFANAPKIQVFPQSMERDLEIETSTCVKLRPHPIIIPPTIGEMMENVIDPLMMGFYKATTYLKQTFKESRRQLLITQLPPYKDCCYTEDDIAALFSKFGFQQTDDNIFAFPQSCLALVLMPTMKSVREVLNVFINEPFTFKGSNIFIDVINTDQLLTPLGLYKKMMKLMNHGLKNNAPKIVFIKNISQEEIKKLRDDLKYFAPFKNFMPLLNKLFIEFKRIEDAKGFGGWYDRFYPGRRFKIHIADTYQSLTPDAAALEEIHAADQGPQPECSAIAAGKREPKRCTGPFVPCASDGTRLTSGETIQHYLHKVKITCNFEKSYFSPKFSLNGSRLLLITNLPNDSYTEADVANLLIPFGFEYHFHTIYVVPQSNMAFITMKTAADVQMLMKNSQLNPLILGNFKLGFDVMLNDFEMSPFEVYRFLMSFTCSKESYDPVRMVLIRNISPSETKELRETLRKLGSVRNFLPLLNKVYIEFDSFRDADRLGVWYSLLREPPSYFVSRLKVPISGCRSLPPRNPELALPESKDIIDGVTAPSTDFTIPQGTCAPFWLTMRHSPHVFPTSSPWFIIPEYRTITDEHSIVRFRYPKFPTIMLTGLPEGKYKHKDVARLVWPYFYEKDRTLHSLYYRVTVLPLQRRAFVFFSDWATCSNFLHEYIDKPLMLKGVEIRFYLVKEEMQFESSEDMLYKSLMKWSNAGTLLADSLEERLLCVEVQQASVDTICAVVEEAAAVASVVNFLPLANRICIEMAAPSGVTTVLQTQNTGEKTHPRGPVLSFETVKSLKQRLQSCNEKSVKFQQFNASIETKLTAFQNQSLNVSQTGPPDGSTISDSISAEPTNSASKSKQIKTEEVQKLAPENTTDFDKGVERVTVKEETPTSSIGATFSSPVISASEVPTPSSSVPKEEPAEEMDTEILQALTAVVRQHRLNLASKSKSTEDESLGGSTSSKTDAAGEASKKRGRGDLREGASERKSLFDEQTLNLEDFVTVDEVGDDADDSNPEPHDSTSSKNPSKETKEKQSSGSRRISTRSSKDAKSSSSSSPSSKGSNSVSASPKKSKDSSDHSKPSSSLSPPEKKSRQSRTKSPAKASTTTSSRRTRSSAAAQEKEKSIEKLEEEAGDVEGAAIKSAHKVSAGATATKSVESETEIETSGEMKRKEERGENDVGQTEEQMDDGEQENSSEIQLPEPKGSQTEQETGQEVTGQDSISTAQQLSGEDESPEVEKSAQGDGEETKQKEEEAKDKILPSESSETPKDAENLEKQNEELSLQEGDNTNDVKDSRSDVTEQPTFEILDSVDDHTAAEDETPGDKIVKEQEDSYQVIDSVEEPVASTETEPETDKAKKDGRPSRRSGRTSKSEEKEKSPKKQDKIHETRVKKEETLFEIVDSVEDTSIQDDTATERSTRRRSTRGKKEDKVIEAAKKPDENEEATFQILDSVEDDEPTVRKSSPRGRRERSKRDVSVEKTKKEDTPTRRRQTPVRESRSREKTPKKEEKEKSEILEPDKEVANFEIVDSVEDEVVKDDPPASRGRGKRGRPKKQDETAKKTATKKEEEEKTYQVVDSVEEESVEDRPSSDPTEISKHTDKQEQSETSPERSTKNEEEEKEPVYQIVDSLEEAQEETKSSVLETEISQTEEDSNKEGASVAVEAESPIQKDDGDKNQCVAEVTDSADITEEETSPIKPQSDAVIPEKEVKLNLQEKEHTRSPLVNLEEVSDEEEDYPDDTAEEEELRKRQAAAKEKQLNKAQEAERSSERQRRSNRRGRGGKGRSREKKEEDVIDTQELVTLDEVGADDVVEGEVKDDQDWDGKSKDLVTLDEFVEEAEKQNVEEEKPPDTSNQKISETSDETGNDGEKTETEKTTRPAKRKHDDDTDECMNFVTVDEVGEEEEKEAVKPKKRGRPKRTRHTPARKSTRGKTASLQEEKEEDELPPSALEASSSSNKETNESKQEAEKREEAETGSKAELEKKQPEESKEEEKKTADIKVLSKLRRELDGPGAKRSRSQSPSVFADFKLPPFQPNNPLGQEFVVPKTGFFCNLCCVFYHNESSAKNLHCSSQKHYDNLKKHYQKLQKKSSSGSVSD